MLQNYCAIYKLSNSAIWVVYDDDIFNDLLNVASDREVPELQKRIASLVDEHQRQEKKQTKELQDAEDALQAMIEKLTAEHGRLGEIDYDFSSLLCWYSFIYISSL